MRVPFFRLSRYRCSAARLPPLTSLPPRSVLYSLSTPPPFLETPMLPLSLRLQLLRALRSLCYPSLLHKVLASPLFMIQPPWSCLGSCLGSTQKFHASDFLSARGPSQPLTWATSSSQCILDLLRESSRLSPTCVSSTVYLLLYLCGCHFIFT